LPFLARHRVEARHPELADLLRALQRLVGPALRYRDLERRAEHADVRPPSRDVAAAAVAVGLLQPSAQLASEEIRRGVAVAELQDGDRALCRGALILVLLLGLPLRPAR